MIAQVVIDPDGCVTATLDTDAADLPIELAGLVIDDLLDQAGRAAISTWIAMHCDSESELVDEDADEA